MVAVEKAKAKAIQVPTSPYLPRINFRFTDPTGFTSHQWRLIGREPVNQMAQRFLQRELTALGWEITSEKKNDARVDKYKKAWDKIFEGGQGYTPWLARILSDLFTVPMGGISEVGYKGGDLAYVNHVDAATVLPTYLKPVPYVQVNPDNWEQRVYFKPGELVRMWSNARSEIRWKEYQRAPTEEAFMVIEALSKIYLYSMQELSDTPSMGILDLADMTRTEALDWAKGFQELLKGIDPFKIPILYDHEKPANWIPFNRASGEIGLADQFRRYVELCLGFYGLSIGDLRLFERTATKAGERVSQMVTERSGVGYWAAIVAEYLTKLLPDGLEFRYKQPRPERDKIVAERKAAQLNMLQTATGGKAFISVKDAVEEAKALEIFTTEVTALKPEDQPQPPPPPGFPQGGQKQPPPGGRQADETEEERDQRKDADLTKADLTALEVRDLVVKALGPGWRHPTPAARGRLGDALQGAFAATGDRIRADQVAPIVDYVRQTLEALGETPPKAKAPQDGAPQEPEEKGSKRSGNWGHRGRPGYRGGSAAGGGHAAVGAKPGHSAEDIRAMAGRQRQIQGRGTKPTAAGIRATARAKERARQAAMAARQAQRGQDAIGNTTEAFGQDPSNRYTFRNRVVPLDSLIASNKPSGEINPEYDQELQPRQRDRTASEMQIDGMARNLQPEALTWDFHQLDKGAPIIGEDHMVESGNGRVLALTKARDAYPEQWANYQKTMEAQLKDAGIDPEAVKGIKDPVLVRERVTDVNRADFARDANSPPVLQMSPLEKARNDARIITDDSLGRFTVGEDQSIDQALRAPANRAFVQTFVGNLPPNEAAGIMRADGSLNRMGLWRIKAGMFAKTFPGDAGDRLADTFFESVDHTTRNFENAIGDALPQLARAEGLISSGQRGAGLSLAGDIAAAMDMHARLKEQGISARNYVAQTSMFGRELSRDQERLLVHFEDSARSRKTIRETLVRYADAVIQSPDPRQGAMFGGMALTKQDLLARVIGEEKGLTAVLGIVDRILKGSALSGNWGHHGYPGRGGSSSGGHAAIGIKPGHSQADKVAILQRRRFTRGGRSKYSPTTAAGQFWRDEHNLSTRAYNQWSRAYFKAKEKAEAGQAALHARIIKEGGARNQQNAAMVREDLLNVDKQYARKIKNAKNRSDRAWEKVDETSRDVFKQCDEGTRTTEDGREYKFWDSPGYDDPRRPAYEAAERANHEARKKARAASEERKALEAERDAKIDRILGLGADSETVKVEKYTLPDEKYGDIPMARADRALTFVNRMVTTEADRTSYVRLAQEQPDKLNPNMLDPNTVSNRMTRPASMIWDLPEDGRARCTINEIHLTPNSGPTTMVHELGHYLEDTNYLIEGNARQFLKYRIKGLTAKPLADITGQEDYRPDEIAVKDKFIEPYMGKIYKGTGTEITSMGMQFLYSDPVRLAKEDPQYFDMMIDSLNGRLWNPPED